MRMDIEAVKWDDGRLDELTVKRPKKKPLHLRFVYSETKILRGLEFDGSADDLPDIPQIVELVSQKFIDRLQAVVDTVDVDITAATMGNVAVDIKAQTVGNLSVNVKTGAISTRNIHGLINASFETADLTGWASNYAYIKADYPAFYAHSGSCGVQMGSGALGAWLEQTFDVPAKVEYIDELSIWIKAQYAEIVTVDFVAKYTDGTSSTHTFTATADQAWIYCNMTPFLTAAKLLRSMRMQNASKYIVLDDAVLTVYEPVAEVLSTVKVDITAQTVGNLGVDIKAQTVGNLDINIAAQAGNVNVNLAAQAGDIDVNITNASIAITGSVTITSGTVNVQTSGGINLVLDKLDQNAYKARGSTLANDNGVTTPTAPPSTRGEAYYAKWFPSGCRGHIYTLSAYCKRTAAGTLTLAYTIQPGMAEMGTVTITPDAAWDWKSAVVNRMWNYDSLFIYVKSISADVSYGDEESATAPDSFSSADSGVTWQSTDRRMFFRATYRYQCVAVLPVGGTINNIEIPSVGSAGLWEDAAVNTGAGEITISDVAGAGKLDYAEFNVEANAAGDCDLMVCRIYCDGVKAFEHTFSVLDTYGYTASTPSISLLTHSDTGVCTMLVTLPLKFKRQISFRALNTGAQNQVMNLRTSLDLIS